MSGDSKVSKENPNYLVAMICSRRRNRADYINECLGNLFLKNKKAKKQKTMRDFGNLELKCILDQCNPNPAFSKGSYKPKCFKWFVAIDLDLISGVGCFSPPPSLQFKRKLTMDQNFRHHLPSVLSQLWMSMKNSMPNSRPCPQSLHNTDNNPSSTTHFTCFIYNAIFMIKTHIHSKFNFEH